MAPPTLQTPPEETLQSKLDETWKHVTENLNKDIFNQVSSSISSLGGVSDMAAGALNGLYNAAAQGGMKFGLLAAGVMKVKGSLKSLSGFDKDLVTFSGPF
jgi:hypothetical protein